MTDHSQLVKRLRDIDHSVNDALRIEAADAIEALTAERDALQAWAEELEAGLRTIAHTFTEDSHGNLKTLPVGYYQGKARALLERKPS